MVPFEPPMHRVFVKIWAPLLIKLRRVLRVLADLHPPVHMSPEEATERRMRVVFFVGMGVVLAMVRDPADRPPFRCTRADRG